MNNSVRSQGKQPDQFVSLTEKGVDWASNNRRSAVIYAIAAVAVILLLVGGYKLFQHRTEAAASAFGGAMEIYQTPLANSGQPVPPGIKTYASESDRAKAANGKFIQVADQYGMTKPGKLALYFAGLTYMEEGENTSAENTLKKVAGDWNGDVAALGKLGLAQLYQQTGRETQAADQYNELAKGKATTVPAGLAQIQLAEMYNAEGKQTQAREIYAKLKDSDKDAKGNPGPVGALAAEKLNPQAAGPRLQ